MKSHDATVRELLDVAGTTYAEQADIDLADKPAPLYRLLVLSVLLSTRIKADIAVAAARELAVFGTPRKMLDATWQQRVDALGRGHYVRYDESTATALGQGAELLLDRYRGDLRRGREHPDGIPKALQEIPKLGPVGAHIFCREAQGVWPELRPYLDKKAQDGAKRVGLPTAAKDLAGLVPGDDLPRLAAALVRVTLEKDTATRLIPA
ncbi:endonuclease [Allosaccharopolyspora coralli]|uniref:Endonuclease n=1 Tax=Allosaccharopolyspora coralli TaxID=2665642 RepID=A0A5Q3Q547_9PSEU|nr:endonuclease [Allosaccharopolyspora coralli]QGK68274.1 endonuclease [Allosaccharopolyspora coralli]